MTWKRLALTNPISALLRVAVSATWIAVLVWAEKQTNFNEPYLPFGIAGALAFFFRAAPSRKELGLWLLASLGFAAFVQPPNVPFWVLSVSVYLAMFGFGAFLLLGLRAIWGGPEVRQNAWSLLTQASTLVLFLFIAQRALSTTGPLHPKTYDLWLFAADGSLGFQPSFLVGRIMLDSRILTGSALLTYNSLPFAMALVTAWHIPVRAPRAPWFMLSLIGLAGLCGWLSYSLLPATGPIYVFGQSFPWHTLSYTDLHRLLLERIDVALYVPRNAMPSLHVAWAVLLLWNCRRFSLPARAAMLLYLVLTILATLGAGQHYLVDLIASFPFALMIQCLTSLAFKTKSGQGIPLVGGLAQLAAWFLLIRFGQGFLLRSRAIPWALAATTIVLTSELARRSNASPVKTPLVASKAAVAGAGQS